MIHDGRNNLGVISLNLPRIAIESQGSEADFWSLLDERLALAKSPDDPYRTAGKCQSPCRADPVYGRCLRRASESR